MTFEIVSCTPDQHATAVRAILNDAIENTTALYDYKPRSAAAVLQWFGAKALAGHPIVGAQLGGQLVGFASYGVFRNWPAYKYTIEHSVYVDRKHRRQGVARLLMQRLIELARDNQCHVMIGGIDATNAASIALHTELGFVHAGTITQAGYKFGRWLDLAFYQLTLSTPQLPTEG